MAARRWRERQAKEVCRDCGREIEPRRLAAGNKCCRDCAETRAEAERVRRRKRKIPRATAQ